LAAAQSTPTALPSPTKPSQPRRTPTQFSLVPSGAQYVLADSSYTTLTCVQEWGTGAVRPEQGILKLRKELDTYGNLRPCFFAAPSLVASSPLKESVCRGTNFTVVRELTGGLYFGEKKEDDGSGYAYDVEPYSRKEIERITRLAAYLALAEDPPAKVWSLDKANVLATSRLWRKTVTEVMTKEFPQLKFDHQLIDSAAMIMIKSPTLLNGIIVTSNLFGDIISDEASVIPGSLGLLPSASLSALPDGKTRVNGIYEPIHGMYRSVIH
jgi:3-isopropylmalate dehydrogenase